MSSAIFAGVSQLTSFVNPGSPARPRASMNRATYSVGIRIVGSGSERSFVADPDGLVEIASEGDFVAHGRRR
jgi:hypothetical protein